MAARTADDGTGITAAALIENVAELREVIERAAEIRRGLLEARRGLGAWTTRTRRYEPRRSRRSRTSNRAPRAVSEHRPDVTGKRRECLGP